MEGNGRTWFTPKRKAELWERWKSGQCVADIARARVHGSAVGLNGVQREQGERGDHQQLVIA